jgi:hypothetical protein
LPDQTDEPGDSERDSNARRLLREASSDPPVSDEPEVPDEGTGEISSSLKHEIAEELGPSGGNLIKTVAEVRGIRKSIARKYRDPLESKVQKNLAGWTPADTHDLLFMAANRHLKAKGRMDFIAVGETAEAIAEAEGKNVSETTTRHFRLWLDKTRAETGSLSIETAAASFIQSWDRLFTLLNGNPEIQAAAQNYADAWHWFHMEFKREHELAAQGAAAERGRKAGPEAKRSQGVIRSEIIALLYKKFAAEELDEAKRTSTKYAADAIFKTVNDALLGSGLEPIADGTLKNQLAAIIKATKAKPT